MSLRQIYTRKLGQSVAELAQPSASMKLHIVSGESSWSVVSEGSVRALRAFATIDQAIDFAKAIALKKAGEVVVHQDNGEIKARLHF
jgi:hypothetical protein